MTILPFNQAPETGVLHTFRNRSWLPFLMVTLVMAGITAYVAIPKGDASQPILVAVPGFTTLILALMLAARLRLTMGSRNWLLKTTERGLYINLRSCLNRHLPGESHRVLFIPAGEVAAVRKTLEQRHVPYRRTRVDGVASSRDRFSCIDIHLAHGDTEALRRVLREERRMPPPHGWIARRKHHDYPVRVIEPPGVRLTWEWIRPGEDIAIRLLAGQYEAAPDREEKLPRWETLDDAGKEGFILDLWERGHETDALRLLKIHKKFGKGDARIWLREHAEEDGGAPW